MMINHVGIHRVDTAVNGGDTAASPFTEPFSAILNHIIGHSELLIVTPTYRAQSTNKDFCLVNLFRSSTLPIFLKIQERPFPILIITNMPEN